MPEKYPTLFWLQVLWKTYVDVICALVVFRKWSFTNSFPAFSKRLQINMQLGERNALASRTCNDDHFLIQWMFSTASVQDKISLLMSLSHVSNSLKHKSACVISPISVIISLKYTFFIHFFFYIRLNIQCDVNISIACMLCDPQLLFKRVN